LPDYAAAIGEMARVLKTGGRLVILEMTPLRRPVMNRIFGLYFERFLPLVGGLISGDREAYRYLPRSVRAFPPAADLAAMMRAAGLSEVRYQRFALGTVALHVGIIRERTRREDTTREHTSCSPTKFVT
jgi:demethylmenaquinone methyltransferase/2-methoxy-6-polyprenyl-1,4-benzoquinol methylase